jgi:CubicO group peptidase (beta-lactamase class C family)
MSIETDISEKTIESVRGILESHVAGGYASGVVALIGSGEESHVLTVGTKALGSADPMRRDTIFRITSMTKPITAAAAMILVDESKLRLDEPLDGLLPELSNRRVLKRIDGPLDGTTPAKRPITKALSRRRCIRMCGAKFSDGPEVDRRHLSSTQTRATDRKRGPELS